MAFDVTAIRKAIATQITNQLTAGGVKAAVYAHPVQTNMFPRVVIMPGTPYIEYKSSFGPGLSTINLIISVQCSAMEAESAQLSLARFLNAGTGQGGSIFDAVEKVTAPALTADVAGAVQHVAVSDVSIDDGVLSSDNTFEYTATFNVAVYVTRS